MDLKMSADKNYPHLIEPPVKNGWFYVRMFQFKKLDDSHPDYIEDWVSVKNREWNLLMYKQCCRVEEILSVNKGD